MFLALFPVSVDFALEFMLVLTFLVDVVKATVDDVLVTFNAVELDVVLVTVIYSGKSNEKPV